MPPRFIIHAIFLLTFGSDLLSAANPVTLPKLTRSWSDLDSGLLRFELPALAQPGDWTFELRFAGATSSSTGAVPGLILEPTSASNLSGGAKPRLSLLPNAKVPGQPDRSLLLHLVISARMEKSSNGTKVSSFSDPLILIEITPDLPILAAHTARYVFSASRMFPFLSPWTLDRASLAVSPHYSAVNLAAFHKGLAGRTLAVLSRPSSPADWDTGARLIWKEGSAAESIPLEIAGLSRFSANTVSGKLSLFNVQEVPIVIQPKDHLFYPVIVIIAGVLVAWGARRWTTNLRLLRVLRADLEDADRIISKSPETPKAFAELWRNEKKEIDLGLAQLERSAAVLDASNSPYVALLARIRAAAFYPAQCRAVAARLHSLQVERNALGQLNPKRPELSQFERPALELALEQGQDPEIFALAGLPEIEKSTLSLALRSARWRKIWERTNFLGKYIDEAGKAESKKLLRFLWDRCSTEEIAAAETKLAHLETFLDPRADQDLASRERFVSAVGPSMVSASTDTALAVERGDAIQFFAAVVLAILTGLNIEYFPKSFGSLWDYSRLLAWGLGVKLGLDLIASAAQRVLPLAFTRSPSRS